MALIDTVLQKGNSSFKKYHFAKIAPNINGISQKCHLTSTLLAFSSTTNTLLIGPTPTIRHRRVIGISLCIGKNSTFKSHDHKSGPYNNIKNFLLKTTQLSPLQIVSGHFFAMCVIFLRLHFFKCHISLS